MSGDGSLVKLFFELPAGSPIGAESLWGAKTSEGRYRLDNSPLYVFRGFAFEGGTRRIACFLRQD
jgi:hypothetical protein